jgi:WD40 repeat protein
MATEIIPSVLRLCRLASVGSAPASHGTTVCAKWDPSCSHRLVTLFTSGVLRVWDVVLDEYIDFALHVPGAAAYVDGARGPMPAKRSAIGVSMFDFLPADSAATTSSPGASLQRGPILAFCTRQARTVYVASLPAPDALSPAAHPESVDFLSGPRVFEYATRLSSDATCIAAWAVAYPSSCSVYVVAVGCSDGSVEAWAGSTGLNPENVTGSRTLRDASPAIVRTRSVLPPLHELPLPPRHHQQLSGPTEYQAHKSSARAHAARVTQLRALPASEAWSSSDAAASLFCSASSDGSVHLWRCAVLAAPSARAPTVIPGDIKAVVVEPLFPIPTDGSLVTAAAAVAWPFRDTTGRLGEALTVPVSGVPRGPRQAGTVEPPRGLRSLLAIGTVDGAVTLFESVYAHDLAVGSATPPALPVMRVVGSLALQPAEPVTSLALSPPVSEASDEGYALAVTDAAGLLRVYSLQVRIDGSPPTHPPTHTHTHRHTHALMPFTVRRARPAVMEAQQSQTAGGCHRPSSLFCAALRARLPTAAYRCMTRSWAWVQRRHCWSACGTLVLRTVTTAAEACHVTLTTVETTWTGHLR